MTVNYFIKCPICGEVTRIRTPAGYIYSTPVRIHCGNCNTLMTGEFISDNNTGRAYYVSGNCKEVIPQDYKYYGEAAGEILCKKISHTPGTANSLACPPNVSPVFGFLRSMSIDELNDFINYACYISDLDKNWDSIQIKYNLYINKKFDLIKEKYCDEAAEKGYCISSNFDISCYFYYLFFFDCGGIFKKKNINKMLVAINKQFRHLERAALNDFIDFLEIKDSISIAQSNLLKLMFDFVKIAKYLIPALCATMYDNPMSIDKETLGITTCSFEDIKNFYQDAFEILAEHCDIVIGLDNINNRNSFSSFANDFDMDKFSKQNKGNKIKHLNATEFFSKYFNFANNSNELRNAIGHNDYNYKGISQIIEYTNRSSGERKTAYLLDVAIECVKLMQSAYVLMFYVYELQRYSHRENRESIPMNPIFYTKTKNQDRCPCGSGKKYKECCKSFIDQRKKNIEQYPNKANTTFTPQQILDIL